MMQWNRYAVRRCWKLLRARCQSVARLSSFLLDILGSWEIFQEHKIIHNIFESARARVKTNQRPQDAYSAVLVSKYLLNRQQWRLCFFSKGVYFPWAMKNICHLDVHSLDNFTCVSVPKGMFILAVNSYNRLFHFTKTLRFRGFLAKRVSLRFQTTTLFVLGHRTFEQKCCTLISADGPSKKVPLNWLVMRFVYWEWPRTDKVSAHLTCRGILNVFVSNLGHPTRK